MKKKKREINIKEITKNPSEGSKPLLQWRTHGNDNEPLPPLLVWRDSTTRESLLIVALNVILPLCLSFSNCFLVALHVVLLLCLPLPFLVALVLFFHSSTHRVVE